MSSCRCCVSLLQAGRPSAFESNRMMSQIRKDSAMQRLKGVVVSIVWNTAAISKIIFGFATNHRADSSR